MSVGVFDSGVGGLSVLRAIRQALPAHRITYVADSAYAPYGDRPAAEIIARANAIADFLIADGSDALVVACNTATAVAIADLRARLSIPVVGIEPGIKPAVAVSKSGVVGILATTRTTEAPKFRALVERHRGEATVIVQPCPGLVEQVERGELATPATIALVRRYVTPLLEAGADTLALGCTHYPFLTEAIQQVAGAGVTLIDPADGVARQVARQLADGVEQVSFTSSPVSFWTSGDPSALFDLVARLWETPMEIRRLPAGVTVT